MQSVWHQEQGAQTRVAVLQSMRKVQCGAGILDEFRPMNVMTSRALSDRCQCIRHATCLHPHHRRVFGESFVEFCTRQIHEAIEAEAFDGEACGDGAVDEGFADVVEGAEVGLAF